MKRIPNHDCMDCGINTLGIDEYYMVQDLLWKTANPQRKGMLCVDCLEKRIGRQLTSADFKPCELTRRKITRSEKLMSRYNSTSEFV